MARFSTAPEIDGVNPMQKRKKPKNRKRGVASRKRKMRNLKLEHFDVSNWRKKEKRLRRFKELEGETQDIFDKVIEPYILSLSSEEKLELEREWELALDVIFYYEDATPDELQDLPIGDYGGTTLSELVESWDGLSESFWRTSYDLSNALGLAMISIDEEGNISGDRVEY